MSTTGQKVEIPPHLWRAAQGLAAEAGTSPHLQLMKALRVGLDMLTTEGAARKSAPPHEEIKR